jgi:diacylglycerol kinase family enzyme
VAGSVVYNQTGDDTTARDSGRSSSGLTTTGTVSAPPLKADETSVAAVAQNYSIKIDGRDVSGDYLLVQVMNVPLLGPRLRVSPLSDASDGVFELVLASPQHRRSLDELARTGEVAEPLAFRVERGKEITVETSEPITHVDGRLWRHAPGIHQFDISVEPSAIHYLR